MCDVVGWRRCSFGVVLWEIITKQPPVRGHLREVRDNEVPPDVQKLLEDCINIDVSAPVLRVVAQTYTLVSAKPYIGHRG